MDRFLDFDQEVKVKITHAGVSDQGKAYAKGLIQAGKETAACWVNPLHGSGDTICENKKYKVKYVMATNQGDIKYRAYAYEDKSDFLEQKAPPKRYQLKKSTQVFLKDFAVKANIKSSGHYQTKAIETLVKELIHDGFLERFESHES